MARTFWMKCNGFTGSYLKDCNGDGLTCITVMAKPRYVQPSSEQVKMVTKERGKKGTAREREREYI